MTTSVMRYSVQTRTDDPVFNYLDAKAIACDQSGPIIYTSPNMSFVPEPHNNEEELVVRADGHFGTADCFLWPQMYCEEYIYAVCIRRKEHYPSPDPLAWAWYRPTIDDFETLTHAAGQVGALKTEKAAGLVSLYRIASDRYKEWKATRGDKTDIASRMLRSLEHDITLLLNHPLTFRDLIVYVAQVQRHFLDIFAFLDFVMYVQARIAYPSGPPAPVHAHWMGCFTTDTKVCDNLFHAGVPVWLIRSPHAITARTIIENPVKFTFPDHIIRSMYSEVGKPPRPFPCLYRGPGGFARHFHTRRHYNPLAPSPSLSQPSTSQVSSCAGKTPTQAQSRRAAQKDRARPQQGPPKAGRDKWVELPVAEMPLQFDVWERAMKRVDNDPSRVKTGIVDKGYRVPEPALLISGQSPERRQLFMKNWLAIRPLWISRLDHDPPSRFPSPQEWREILHGVPNKEELESASTSCKGNGTAKGRKLAALDVFGEVAASLTQYIGSSPAEEVEWRSKHIPIASLTNPPPRLIKAILWEIYEIGWRYELCALDQAINPQLWAEHRTERVSLLHSIFPGSSGLVLWSEPLPTSAGDLGLTDSWSNNEQVLRSFCLLLSSWPNGHPSWSYLHFTKERKDIEAYDIMLRACQFYVQTFFDHFGRPPLLPHRFPLDYHNA